MKRKTNYLAPIGLAVLAFTMLAGCATFVPTPTNDPFTQQLDKLYTQRQQDQTWMIASAATAAAGSVAATTFTTLDSLNKIQPNTANIGTIISYIFTAIGAGSTVWSFIEYNKAVGDYMETLKLQTQYYNLLQPQN